MSYSSKYTKASYRGLRHSDRTQSNQLRRLPPSEIVEHYDTTQEGLRYARAVEAMESQYRRRAQSRSMGEKIRESQD